jgi:hypothetical protein
MGRAESGGFLRRFSVGPQVGVFLPSSGKTANRFGDTWFSLGVGFGRYSDREDRGRITADFDLFQQSHGSNHAFLLPVGLAYEQGLGRSGRAAPYVGLSANAVLTDIRSDQDGIASRYRMAYGGSAFAGVNYGPHAQFEVRYYALSRVRSLDLSGLSVQSGYRF